MLIAEHIHVRYGQKPAVRDLSLHLREGQWLVLAGPNGAGKSTLLSALAQTTPYSGTVTLLGQDARRLSSTQLARHVGVLTQRHSVGFAYAVEDVVRLGRYAHRRGFFSECDADAERAVERALAETGLTDLRRQSVLKLSGGELQRVFLAQVFAQDPRILLLDEPANHLDPPYQRRIFSMIENWLRSPGRAVISVVHDLSLARHYGTRFLLMHEGRCVASGTDEDVFTPQVLSDVYGMDIHGWINELLSHWNNA